MPQLQINQGPQDALLYDNSRSYFTNVGYVRTSNFQVEYRDVDPQNTATLGSTVQFVIPKAADLLGPVDLLLEFTDTSISSSARLGSGTYSSDIAALGWVESLGYAMIDRIVFSVGSHDIQTVTGDEMYITNELMRADDHRFMREQILKTGRPLLRSSIATTVQTNYIESDTINYHNSSRLICTEEADGASTPATTFKNYKGKKLIVPLKLFFTGHPSQYFPLDAIAGCNDVRISIKLRTFNELIQLRTSYDCTSGAATAGSTAPSLIGTIPTVQIATGTCKLRCHYIHVTGPEAAELMNKEHIRLIKLWQQFPVQNTIRHSAISTTNQPSTKLKLFDFELPFLHPVSELIIIIRKTSEMTNSTDASALPSAYDQKARNKNYFAFQGGGKDPNIDSFKNSIYEAGTTAANEAYLLVDNFKLVLNGQERHPSLASTGLDRNYLQNRLMPMLHSNTSNVYEQTYDGSIVSGTNILTNRADLLALSELLDRKEIYVYPLCLAPEGANPSGAVNFSKVSHGKLTIEGYALSTTADAQVEYQCDVFGVSYNWLQIKDGRALTSFA